MKGYLEIVAGVIMLLGLGGLLYDRIKYKKGIGVRAIQFLAVVFIIPSLLILGLEGTLNSETLGTLFGAIVGYVLSGIGKDEPNR